jgi:hypothetical protein
LTEAPGTIVDFQYIEVDHSGSMPSLSAVQHATTFFQRPKSRATLYFKEICDYEFTAYGFFAEHKGVHPSPSLTDADVENLSILYADRVVSQNFPLTNRSH